MKKTIGSSRRRSAVGGICVMLLVGWLVTTSRESQASPPWVADGRFTGWGFFGRDDAQGPTAMSGTWYRFPRRFGGHGGCADDGMNSDLGGTWQWMRSPEQEKVVVSGLFNRYCIRCHGVDGRGIWDIPGVPDFTNTRWQASRSDDQIARIIVEGRGAVMPQFRGAISLEEAFGIARYLRTFVPGTQPSRPDFNAPKTDAPK